MELKEIDKTIVCFHKIFENEENIQIYSLYRKFFIEYILNMTNLKSYDDKLENSSLKFLKTIKEKMDGYQFFSCDVLNYFYLRNNLYIDKLTEEEIKELKNRISLKDYIFDEQAKKLIGNSYKRVLKYSNDEDIIKYSENYDDFLVAEGTLVIAMKYDEFGESELHGKMWLEEYFKKLEIINEIFKDLKKEIEEKLLIPVEILKY